MFGVSLDGRPRPADPHGARAPCPPAARRAGPVVPSAHRLPGLRPAVGRRRRALLGVLADRRAPRRACALRPGDPGARLSDDGAADVLLVLRRPHAQARPRPRAAGAAGRADHAVRSLARVAGGDRGAAAGAGGDPLPARQLGARRGRRPRSRAPRRRARRAVLHPQGRRRAGTSRGRRSRRGRRPATSTPGSTMSPRPASTTTSSSSSTSTTVRRPTTSTVRSAISATPRSPGCRRRASAATSTPGPPVAWPSRTSSCRARCRWASTATAARRSSSARTRPTAPPPSARSAASSRRAPRTTSTPSCLPPRATAGVYVPEIIAVGDGPEDLGTYLGQQFAWAYSMIQILLRHTPRLSGATPRARHSSS